MTRVHGVVAIVTFGAIVACVSSEGLAGGGDGGVTSEDAGGTDTSSSSSSSGSPATDASPPDAGPAPAPNLITNGDFELGCAGWNTAFGFMSEASEAHGGTKSCKFCMDTNWEAFLEQTVTANVEAGKTYYVEAWLKPAKTLSELDTAGYVESNLRVKSPGANIDPTNGPTATGDWVRSTAIFKPTLPANELDVDVRLQQTGNPAATGNVICFYVDDVVLRRLD